MRRNVLIKVHLLFGKKLAIGTRQKCLNKWLAAAYFTSIKLENHYMELFVYFCLYYYR